MVSEVVFVTNHTELTEVPLTSSISKPFVNPLRFNIYMAQRMRISKQSSSSETELGVAKCK